MLCWFAAGITAVLFDLLDPLARRRHPGATSGIPGWGPSGGAPESSRAGMRRKEAAVCRT